MISIPTPHHHEEADPTLLLDTLNLLSGERSGHMAQHAFRKPAFDGDLSGGLVYWAEAVKHPYFPANLETHLFHDEENVARIMSRINDQSRNVSFIEIGAGLYESVKAKTVPMIGHFLQANGQGEQRRAEYISIDVADDLAEVSAERILHDLNVTSKFYKEDFTKIDSKVPTEGYPSVAFLWGGTLWNAPSSKVVESNYLIASQLSNLGKMIGVGGYLAMTYYWVPDDRIAEKLVPYQTDANKAAVRSILYAIKNDISHGLNPENFDIKIEYNRAAKAIKMEAESLCDQTIELGAVSGFKRNLKKGERLTLVNSHRRTSFEVEELSRKADFSVLDNIRDDKNCMGIVLLQYRGPQ